MNDVFYIIVALFSTLIGAVSGMGGGVIMKPVFDLAGDYDASGISALTSSTVLAMSLVSVAVSAGRFKKEKENTKTILLTAFGSLFGGLAGDKIFRMLTQSAQDGTVKAVQNIVLLVLVVFVIIYMRSGKKTLGVKNSFAGLPVGFALGLVSAFLGIGGGPINVAVLTAVFGFGIKTAVLCSLTSVLAAQAVKVSSTLINTGISAFSLRILPFVVAAGVCGALIGRFISRKSGDKTANIMFTAVQFIVILICAVNICMIYFR